MKLEEAVKVMKGYCLPSQTYRQVALQRDWKPWTDESTEAIESVLAELDRLQHLEEKLQGTGANTPNPLQ